MHRVDTPSRQKDKFGAGKDGFTNGDPQTGTPATEVPASWLDAVQEELSGVIEMGGLSLKKSDNNQLHQAIVEIIRGQIHASKSSNNFIINGAMQVHHRGAKFNLTGAGGYTIDRWFLGKSAAAPAVVAERVLDVPPSSGVVAALKTKILGVITPKQDDYYCIQQLMEGVDIAPLQGNTIFISFWVKSSVTGTYSVSLYGGLTEHSFVTEYKIDKPNEWQKVTVVIDGGFPLNQPLQLGDECGMKLSFSLGCGSNYQTDKLAGWVKGAFHGSKNQVNLLTKKDAEFSLTAVTLTTGGFPLSATGRSHSEELALCQRYFVSVVPHITLNQQDLVVPCSRYAEKITRQDKRGFSYYAYPTPVSMRGGRPIHFHNGELALMIHRHDGQTIKIGNVASIGNFIGGLSLEMNDEFADLYIGAQRSLRIESRPVADQPSGFDAELYP